MACAFLFEDFVMRAMVNLIIPSLKMYISYVVPDYGFQLYLVMVDICLVFKGVLPMPKMAWDVCLPSSCKDYDLFSLLQTSIKFYTFSVKDDFSHHKLLSKNLFIYILFVS